MNRNNRDSIRKKNRTFTTVNYFSSYSINSVNKKINCKEVRCN